MLRTTVACAILLASAGAQKPVEQNPVELGAVKWHRDFDAATKLAKQAEKPILLLFQEVPG